MNPHPSHQFKPGGPPGPGRPKGSVGGRAQAIALIDQIITDNDDELRAALEKEFHESPVKFWQRYGFPLVPTALVAKVETAPSCGPWITLLEAARFREIEKRAQAAGLELPPIPIRHQRNGGPMPDQEEDTGLAPPCWPSPTRPPGALPPINRQEPCPVGLQKKRGIT